jgi:membrane-bound lytic murein transglycosylase
MRSRRSREGRVGRDPRPAHESGGIEPYPTRRAIEAGALLANKKLELAWLKDPIDAYIAHVNGSAS